MPYASTGTTRCSAPSRRTGLFLFLTLLVFVGSLPGVRAAGLYPPNFSETNIGNGLNSPTAMALAPDGRIFVCQQTGQLRVIKNGLLLSTPFVSLNVDSRGERGLLGVAFDPNFTANGHVYLYYTATTPVTHNRVVRFTANGDVAAPGSELVLLDLEALSGATNHNGGALHFGPDGKLYVAVGDNANGNNSQTLNNRLGKVLRLNPDGSIPPDNPFFGTASGNNRAIWALGLRNPFTFAFQPGTGRMHINDVGQNTWEEINVGMAGVNYGWPATEGPTTDPRYVTPLFAYTHGGGSDQGFSIAGGVFYNPGSPTFPAAMQGTYFFADFVSGWIRRVDPVSGVATDFATGLDNPVDLRVGSDGALYCLSRGRGAVVRIQYTNPAPTVPPQITRQPENIRVAAGYPATFRVEATGDVPLSYQWQRNGSAIVGATGAVYTFTAALADNGAKFRCIVSNGAGSATSDEATLEVVALPPPTATITLPLEGARYNAGGTLRYEGTATDGTGAPLPASAYSWRIDFHHDTHFHPFVPETAGQPGNTVTLPTEGEPAASVWYRIHLTVTDTQGLSHSTFRDIHPNTATLQLETFPAGLQVTLDGQPKTAPLSVLGVVGFLRTLGAPLSQTLNGIVYEFERWSDGQPATHTVSTPATDTTYTARYRLTPPHVFPAGLQLIASPLSYNGRDPREVLGLAPASEAHRDFNVAEWASTAYMLSPTTSLLPGRGYFVRFRDSASVQLPSSVPVAGPEQPVDLALSEGWNLIGLPFDPTRVLSLNLETEARVLTVNQQGEGVLFRQAVEQGLLQAEVWEYAGSNQGGHYIRTRTLLPWKGYWLRVFSPLTLRLLPASSRAAVGGKGSTLPAGQEDAQSWRLQIAVRQGDRRDLDNFLGVSEKATEGFDPAFDYEEPPAPAATSAPLTLSFPGQLSSGRSIALSDDIRGPDTGSGRFSRSWKFTVSSTAGSEEVTLTWPGVARLPRLLNPVLIDEASSKRIPLRSRSSYTYRPTTGVTHSFHLEVGRRSSVPLQILNLNQQSRGRRFTFTTTQDADIEVELLKVNGERVRLLRTRSRAAQETSVGWDGRSEAGAPLAPGPYLLSLTARDADGNLVRERRPFLWVR